MCNRYQDPFEEYKTRLAKKLARKAESEENVSSTDRTHKEKQNDDMNWFGVKLGATNGHSGGGGEAGSGVGKYLNLNTNKKRALEAPSPAVPTGKGLVAAVGDDDDAKKKRKIGFGDFSEW